MMHSMKQEFTQAMDGLAFSGQDKADMTQRLLNMTQVSPKSFSGRKLILLSLAAVLILTTMTAAAVYIRWPVSSAKDFHFSEEDKKAAEQSGLAVLPQTDKSKTSQIVSATDQGVTISVVQTLMDPYRAVLIFRVEGVELPDGVVPCADWDVTMSGRPAASAACGFFDGFLETSPGVFTYADGSPRERDENGIPIPRPAAEDGSLEYSIVFTYDTPQSSVAEVTARCSSIYIYNDDEIVTLAEGCWELSWTLTGSDQSRIVQPNVPIGDSGYYLKRAELSSLTAILEISGTDRAPESPSMKRLSYGVPDLEGVMLKDGTYRPISTGTMFSVTPTENKTLLCNSAIQVVDVDQIEALVFYNGNAELIDGEYVQCDSYIVPIS